MALSIQKDRTGPAWPVGSVVVATVGTPVNLMVNVDPSNNNAPGTPTSTLTAEYATACRGFGIQGYHAGANNNGMIPNSGNLYLMKAAAGGTGNRADSGSIVKIIPPGGDFFFPADGTGMSMFSPYNYWLDADANNDAGLVTLYGLGNP